MRLTDGDWPRSRKRSVDVLTQHFGCVLRTLAYEHLEIHMNDIVRIMKAPDFAARKHTDQRRKGDASEPYVNHLIEVADLVAEATEGNPDAVVAALLHDAVETRALRLTRSPTCSAPQWRRSSRR
jgi:(p)ppGpp synthase/HD superfamily hydrolase